MPSCELLRRRLMQDIFDRMSDEEKRLYVLMSLRHRTDADFARTLAEHRHEETMQALAALSRQAQRNYVSWWADLGSNIAGNAIYNGAEWLISRLLHR